MDPYVYPGTNVLRNLPGIQDRGQLDLFETNNVMRRLLVLDVEPVSGSFDIAHLQAIHGYLFQDVYEWAGKFRTVNISRTGQYYFAFVDRIEAALGDVFRKLARERYLSDLGPAEFSARAGHYLGEINAVHPFREGNGRTQREFIRELAARNGHRIDWTGVTREQMGAASRLSFSKGDSSELAALIHGTIRT
jgi:cell filamentation protein